MNNTNIIVMPSDNKLAEMIQDFEVAMVTFDPKRSDGSKSYPFKASSPVKETQQVLCHVGEVMMIGEVTEVTDKDALLDSGADEIHSWIVSTVDTSDYDARLEGDERTVKNIRRAKQKVQRNEILGTFAEGLGQQMPKE